MQDTSMPVLGTNCKDCDPHRLHWHVGMLQGIRTPDIAAWQRFAQAPATLATTDVTSEM